MYILLENIVRENVVYPITFVVKFFLMLHDIWNEVMKHKLPCRSALVLQKSWLWPKILGNRLGVLTSVFIAIDYFFRCHKSTFNLKNHKCIFKDFFLLLRIYLHRNYFPRYVYLRYIYKPLKGIAKIQFVSELTILLNL